MNYKTIIFCMRFTRKVQAGETKICLPCPDLTMMDDFWYNNYDTFNCALIILSWWMCDYERLCAMGQIIFNLDWTILTGQRLTHWATRTSVRTWVKWLYTAEGPWTTKSCDITIIFITVGTPRQLPTMQVDQQTWLLC